MTKRHFIAIAAIIKGQVESLALVHDDGSKDLTFFPNGEAFTAVETTAKELATFFASQNPLFDRDRFLTACGVQ